MKKIFLILLSLAFSSSLFSQTGEIEVHINHIPSSEGFVEIGVFNTAKTFTIYNKNFTGTSLKSKAEGLTHKFQNIPVGTYAIAVWHDKNENKKLDKNFFGIPKESYGFSLNKFGLTGPPDFEKVAFEVKENKIITLHIHLKN